VRRGPTASMMIMIARTSAITAVIIGGNACALVSGDTEI
jgi:hypothetical protein